jgi:hypothetical protein
MLKFSFWGDEHLWCLFYCFVLFLPISRAGFVIRHRHRIRFPLNYPCTATYRPPFLGTNILDPHHSAVLYCYKLCSQNLKVSCCPEILLNWTKQKIGALPKLLRTTARKRGASFGQQRIYNEGRWESCFDARRLWIQTTRSWVSLLGTCHIPLWNWSKRLV